ncbi:50S ribosomal protein L29P [Aeropyrum pernix K1]|uniref:Large ribosomal subunit protein uL29 n=1 Tax=Aeropyrum pernix (strain ATCC 700893 / DSM 11879 / JCM 9820 / NBRC 100138 / K1) TaxID=272557 RepID=RL29_AERPE|nr:50S ribosomal protein L29 [Aeropyrum pernix]P58085.2 RecName: Full=Large ribosomal subunit protein uL29; AltName: Full=50S ribosomal protein L29 [Aeropyrum pernix K1]BAF34725.1 50S ribosomal protein L29P [Aeropyrum pernix K1]
MGKFKMRSKDLRGMSVEELEKTLRELRIKLMGLRYKAKVGLLENPGELREARRNVARILTVLREKREGEKA